MRKFEYYPIAKQFGEPTLMGAITKVLLGSSALVLVFGSASTWLEGEKLSADAASQSLHVPGLQKFFADTDNDAMIGLTRSVDAFRSGAEIVESIPDIELRKPAK